MPVDDDLGRHYIDKDGKVTTDLPLSQATCLFDNKTSILSDGFCVAYHYTKPFSYDPSEGTNPKYGYIDKNGKIIIDFKFDYAMNFSDGLAVIQISDNNIIRRGWGIIDKRGKYIVEPQYQSIYPFQEGRASVEINGKWGFLDKKGRVKIDARYDLVGNFSNQLAPVMTGNKWGYINKNGKIVIPWKFDEAGSFNNGLAPVRLGDEWSFINTKGNIIIDQQFLSADSFCGSFARVVTKENKVAIINDKGKIISTFSRPVEYEPYYLH